MSDVDDELLALVGGSSSSHAGSPAASSRRRRKRRRDADSDVDEDEDEDAVGSDEEMDDDDDDEANDEPVNPFRLEGIYRDEEDRERLLDMPELEREAELAARRDMITARRQKADLRAMVRTQQLAGRKTQQRSSKPATKKKTRKLKRAAAPTRRRRKADSDDEQDESEEEQDDEDEESEEEEEESDYETSRRGARSRKAVGKTSAKSTQLQKLKKSRAKAQRRKQGGGGGGASDDESSGAESESSYDAEEAEAIWRRKKERERVARGDTRREVKQTREEERRRKGLKWTLPSLSDVNAARVKRDHFTRLVHRPEWMTHLRGKFARINYTQKDRSTGRVQTSYRLVQIIDCHDGDAYYEVADQYTNATCDLAWGSEKLKNITLQFVSNSPVSEQEYAEWQALVNQMDERKVQRAVPSHEATQDQADELEAFISRPFTEQDINQMLAQKKLAREAFQTDQEKRQQRKTIVNGNGGATNSPSSNAPRYDATMLGEMNVKHRKADRERIVEAERRNALAIKLAAQRLSSHANTPSAETPPGLSKSTTTSMPASPLVKATVPSVVSGEPTSIAVAAADVEIDLGDF